jgi:uncharacterized tellurite resistance protein B-like protein
MHEPHPAPESVTLNPQQAFAAIVVGAFNADGHVAPEEAVRVNEIFNSTKLFRHPSAEPVQGVVNRVLEFYRVHGADELLTLAPSALPPELRAPAFPIAVDLVLADGQASSKERTFIDALQARLTIPDEAATRIVEVLIIKNSV